MVITQEGDQALNADGKPYVRHGRDGLPAVWVLESTSRWDRVGKKECGRLPQGSGGVGTLDRGGILGRSLVGSAAAVLFPSFDSCEVAQVRDSGKREAFVSFAGLVVSFGLCSNKRKDSAIHSHNSRSME